MAPPHDRAGPDFSPCISRLISAVSTFFKPKHSLRPSSRTSRASQTSRTSRTSKGKKGSINLMDLPVPPIYPPPLTPELLPTPTGFDLKPAGPEKEPWLEIQGLQGSDDFHELTSNPWSYKQKRSSNFSPLPRRGHAHDANLLLKQAMVRNPA